MPDLQLWHWIHSGWIKTRKVRGQVGKGGGSGAAHWCVDITYSYCGGKKKIYECAVGPQMARKKKLCHRKRCNAVNSTLPWSIK